MPANDVSVTGSWAINSYDLTYVVDGKAETIRTEYKALVEIKAEPTKAGYTFSGWSVTENFNMPAEAVTISGTFTANTDTAYTVEHYQENLDGTYPETATETENLTGTTDTKATATAKTYTGFTFAENAEGNVLEGNIDGEGSLVLKLYYARNSYEVSYSEANKPADAPETPAAKSYKYGAAVPAAAVPSLTGYTFTGWNNEVTTMPANDVSVTGSWAINSYGYVIHHYLLGTTTSVKDDETGEAVYNTVVNATPATQYEKLNLVIDQDNSKQSMTIKPEGNEITVFYTLPLTITPESNSKTYGENDPKLIATVEGMLDGDSVKYDVIRDEGENAGTYAIKASGKTAQGYYMISYVNVIGEENILFTINPASVELTANSVKEAFTYNGEGRTVEGFTSSVEGLTFADTVKATRTETDAGTYTTSVEGVIENETKDSTGNYVVTKVNDGSFTIAKKIVTFEAETLIKPWGADDPEGGFKATVTGLVGEDEIGYTVKRIAGETATTRVDEAASSEDTTIAYNDYKIYVEIDEKDEDLKNYEPELINGKLTIKKTPVEIVSSIDGLEEIYSGTIVKLTAKMDGLDDYKNNYAYQWQVADTKDGDYEDIKDATSRDYEYVLNKDTIGKHYRVVITLK